MTRRRLAGRAGKLTRGLAPQYQDLTRCVSPPSRWVLQPPKPPPPPPLSEFLSSLPSSSSSSSKSRSRSPAPRLPLPIISASLPSQPPSLSCRRDAGDIGISHEHHRKLPHVSARTPSHCSFMSFARCLLQRVSEI